jgi:hypothetical protein
LNIEKELLDVLSLDSLLAERLHHLVSVADASLFPKGHKHSFEIIINVASVMDKV